MLHKNVEMNLRMDPDSPLNRAHQIERQAEKMLQSGRYDQASSCYIRAADHLEVAIQQTQSPPALLSLRLQLENLRKQPTIVKKRQQWNQCKQDSVRTLWNGRFLNDDAAASGGGDLADRPLAGEVPEGGAAEPDSGRTRTDSGESRFSSLEETDSLLAMIRQHHVVENEQPRYHVQRILSAFRALGPGGRHRDVTEPPKSSEPAPGDAPGGHGLPEMQQMLLAQNQELQGHLKQLFRALDSCQQENQKLTETVSDLRRDLEECRMRCVSGQADRFGMAANCGLDAPFSLMDGFACSPPSESLPPLSPLHIPDFDGMI